MKNAKKVLSILLAVVLIGSFGALFAAADDDVEPDWKEVKLRYEDITELGDLYIDWDTLNELYKTIDGYSDSTPEDLQYGYTHSWWDKMYYAEYSDPVQLSGPHIKLESTSTGETGIIGPKQYLQSQENGDPSLYYLISSITAFSFPHNWVKWDYESQEELSEGDYYLDKEAWADWLVSSGKCADMEAAKAFIQNSFNYQYSYYDENGDPQDVYYTYKELYYDPPTKAVWIVHTIDHIGDMPINDEYVFPHNGDYKVRGFQFIKQYDPSAQPDTPEQPAAEICKWCGQPHGDGFFQKIIAFFHRIFAAIFGAKY